MIRRSFGPVCRPPPPPEKQVVVTTVVPEQALKSQEGVTVNLKQRGGSAIPRCPEATPYLFVPNHNPRPVQSVYDFLPENGPSPRYLREPCYDFQRKSFLFLMKNAKLRIFLPVPQRLQFHV